MSVVHVHIWKGRSIEQKRAAAKAITEAMVEHLGVHKDGLHVTFQDYELGDWARAGVLGVDRKDIPKDELETYR